MKRRTIKQKAGTSRALVKNEEMHITKRTKITNSQKNITTSEKVNRIEQSNNVTEQNETKVINKRQQNAKRLREPESKYEGMMTRSKRRKIEQDNRAEAGDSNDNFIKRTNNLSIFLKRLTEEDLVKAGVYTQKTSSSKDDNVPKRENLMIEPKHESKQLAISIPDFVLNEIVWAKIRGSAPWPARIDRISLTKNGIQVFEIVWYNDYRRSKIYKTQLNKFLENFEKFAPRFDDVIGLRTAAFEAMYEYRGRMDSRQN